MSIQNLVNRINQAKNLNQSASNQITETGNRTFGNKPEDGEPGGPYAYFETQPDLYGMSSLGGISYGAGIIGYRDGRNQIDAIYTNVNKGVLRDNGNTRGGGKGGTGFFKSKVDLLSKSKESGETPESSILDFEGNFANAQSEGSFGNDGFTVGGGASLIDGAITFGNIDAENTTDSNTRVGLGLGVGLGVRGHWDDADNDGYREYGWGVDVLFLSFDVKREDWTPPLF